MNVPTFLENLKTRFYSLSFVMQILLVEIFIIALTFLSNLILPQITAVWGYLLGALLTKILAKKGTLRPFLSAFALSLVALLLGNVVSFFYLFLSQTELYTIYEYLDGATTPYIILFALGLGIALSLIAIYANTPSVKKNNAPQYTDFS